MLDYLVIGVYELVSISERRIERFVNLGDIYVKRIFLGGIYNLSMGVD